MTTPTVPPAPTCRTCARVVAVMGAARCGKWHEVPFDLDNGACFDYTPAPRPFRQLCADCTRFTLHGTRLLCGAYPGADAPPNLATCPMFAPRHADHQPTGNPNDAINL